MLTGPEMRKFRRVPMVAAIEIEVGDVRFTAEARNISVAGMLIRSSRTFDQNSILRIWFTLPGTQQPLGVRGTILHVSPDAYMGVQFDEISEAGRAAIEIYVNQASEFA